MALTMADAPAIALGFLACENRTSFYNLAYTAASGNADLQAFITWIAAGADLQDNLVAQLRRTADAVQELQAALPTIKVTSHLESKDAVGEVDVEFIPAS